MLPINKGINPEAAALRELVKTLSNQEAPVSSNSDIMQRIHRQAASVIRFSLSQWQNAYEDAIDPRQPERIDLLDLYEQIEIDDQVSALVETIYNKLISREFIVCTPDGEEDQEVTDLFSRPWFWEFVAGCINADLYGFTGLQVTGLQDGIYSGLKNIPRRHIVPELKGVRYHENTRYKIDESFDDPRIRNWTIFLNPQLPADQYRLGKYNKLAKPFILKREVTQFWAIFNELFGIPYRALKTSLQDSTRKQNAITAMETMTAAAYSVIDQDDELEFHNPGASNNASTFDLFCKRMDNSMSKILIGGTMVLEDGSSRSQAEVHERNSGDFVTAAGKRVAAAVNGILFPKMKAAGIISRTADLQFKWNDTESLSKTETVDIITKLNAAGFQVPLEYVIEHTGIPVEAKAPTGDSSTPPDDDPEGSRSGTQDPDDPDFVPDDVQNKSLFSRMFAMFAGDKRRAAKALQNRKK